MKRLKETTGKEEGTEAIAGALLRQGDPAQWVPAALPPLTASIDRPFHFQKKWVRPVSFALLGAAVALASYLLLIRQKTAPEGLPPKMGVTPAPRQPAELPPVVEAPVPAVESLRPAVPRKVAPRPIAKETTAPKAPAPTEAELLQKALHALRVEKSKENTQQWLSMYRQQFPDGVLSEEAYRLETELRLKFERVPPLTTQALAASQSATDWEGALFWVETQVAQPQPPDLNAVLEVLLQKRGQSSLRERTLYAATLWALKRGDADQAESLAQTYLKEFPNGRFSPSMNALRKQK